MVVHTYNPALRRQKQGYLEFKASLDYIARCWETQRGLPLIFYILV
jgi:hypothetical protein